MNKKNYVVGLFFSLILILSNFLVSPVFAQNDSDQSLTTRLAGTNRYETSLEIVKDGWTQASNVIIATGTNFPDALSASALSKSKNAPIILTKPKALSPEAIEELKKLDTEKAYLIGGTGVISTSIESQLKSLGIKITRLGGTTRYETSLKIAEQIGGSNGVTVAMGDNFPDALSIASIASSKSMPILLSKKAGLDKNMKSFIKNEKVPSSYIVGGTGVLDASLDKSLPNSKRLSGNTRYRTNLAINSEFQNDLNFDTVYLATGSSFPDALSGSALASMHDAPIFLTKKDEISNETLEFMKKNNVKHVVILGGDGAVSQEVEDRVNTELVNKVTSVSLDKTTDTIKLGDSDTLTATVSPGNATNQAVKWASSNQNVASVDDNGKVTAKAVGTATITVTTEDGKFTADCKVKVQPILATSVSLNKSTDSIKLGDSDTLTATVSPDDATNQAVKWSSSNSEVASVDENGKVTAKSVGTATITVTTEDGKFTAECDVEVQPIRVTSVSLNKTSDTLIVGNKETFEATVSPSNATNQKVSWASSDESIATVDANGTVTAISEGKTDITATTEDGDHTATLSLTVEGLKIASIDDINKTVYQWDSYSLPEQVSVTMNNGTKVDKNVTWDSSEADTSDLGGKTYQGTVEDFEGKVNLHLSVKAIENQLHRTSSSSVLISGYYRSYGITLSNYSSRDIDIEKIEIYDNGNRSGTYTKEDLSSSNVPTVIGANSQWNISFNFRFGISSTNSYFMLYINSNGHTIPCKYPMN